VTAWTDTHASAISTREHSKRRQSELRFVFPISDVLFRDGKHEECDRHRRKNTRPVGFLSVSICVDGAGLIRNYRTNREQRVKASRSRGFKLSFALAVTRETATGKLPIRIEYLTKWPVFVIS